jgi:hypothetical protein
MTENNNDDLAAERDRLQAEVMRLRVERQTGVPASMLSTANTEEEALAQAEAAIAWKAATPAAPKPPTAAVTSSYLPRQISRPLLSQLSPADTMSVYRQGRLAAEGAPAPGPRQNGEHGATH